MWECSIGGEEKKTKDNLSPTLHPRSKFGGEGPRVEVIINWSSGELILPPTRYMFWFPVDMSQDDPLDLAPLHSTPLTH